MARKEEGYLQEVRPEAKEGGTVRGSHNPLSL